MFPIIIFIIKFPNTLYLKQFEVTKLAKQSRTNTNKHFSSPTSASKYYINKNKFLVGFNKLNLELCISRLG